MVGLFKSRWIGIFQKDYLIEWFLPSFPVSQILSISFPYRFDISKVMLLAGVHPSYFMEENLSTC